MPRINFANVKTLEALPAGDYGASLTEVKYVEKSRSSGQPYYRLGFTVTDDGEYSGRKLFRNASLTEESLWAIKAYLIALGTDPEELEGDADVDELFNDRIGSDCVIVVDVKKLDDGRDSNEIKTIKDATFA